MATKKAKFKLAYLLAFGAAFVLLGYGLKTMSDRFSYGAQIAEDSFVQRKTSFPFLSAKPSDTATLVAHVDDMPITIADLRLAAARENLNWPLSKTDRQRLLQGLAARMLFARAAEQASLDQDPLFVSAVQDIYLSELVRRYKAANVPVAQPISAADVSAFIDANPGLFGDRKHYAFDGFDIDSIAFSAANRGQLAGLASAADLISYFERRNIDYVQNPFSFYSEELPPEILSHLPDYEDGLRNFFLRQNDIVRIIRVIGVRPAPVDSDTAQELALRRLTIEQLDQLMPGIEDNLLQKITGGDPLPLTIY